MSVDSFQGQEGTEDFNSQQGDQQEQQNSGNNGGGHPAWQELLSEVPESLHPIITPHLQKWDQGVNERFQSLHSEYEPWKGVIENADPEFVQQAIGLVQRLNEDPEYVYRTLGETYGFLNEQGTTGQQGANGSFDEDDDDSEGEVNNPFSERFSQMENVLGGIAQYIQSQQQHEQEQQALAQYSEYMQSLTEKYGAYDEDVVDAMVANGVDPEQAVQRYQQSVRAAAQQLNSPGSRAPVVMSGSNGGSGLPSEATPPSQLSSKDTKALVMQMLQQDQQS